MTLMFAEFGSSKPKCHRDSYAFNVLEYIDASASEGGKTSESSTTKDSATKSSLTYIRKIKASHKFNYYVLVFL